MPVQAGIHTIFSTAAALQSTGLPTAAVLIIWYTKPMAEEKIMTLHPEGKQGVNINKVKYDQIKDAILTVLAEQGEVCFQDLPAAVDNVLDGDFDGSIGWYITTVKLDLEARGLIERIPKRSPQVIRLVSSA